METHDLLQELGKETEVKTPNPEIQAEMSAPAFDPNAQPPVNEVIPEAVQGAQAPPVEPEEMPIPPKESAKLFIEMLNGISTLFLPGIFKKKLTTPKQKEILEKLEASGKDDEFLQEYSEEEQRAALKKRDLIREAIRGVPFTEEEKTFLEDPLAKVIEKHGMKTSPEVMLVIALLTVAMPRVAVLFREP